MENKTVFKSKRTYVLAVIFFLISVNERVGFSELGRQIQQDPSFFLGIFLGNILIAALIIKIIKTIRNKIRKD